MKKSSFNFRNNSQNWHLEKTYFENLNLLVGASGVGKTRILNALYLICNVAQGEVQMLENVEGSIDFSHFGQKYRWNLKALNPTETTFSSEQNHPEIVEEKLIKLAEDNEPIEIFHRTKTESTLNKSQIPKLKRTESAITLLAEEESIASIADAFKRRIKLELLLNVLAIAINWSKRSYFKRYKTNSVLGFFDLEIAPKICQPVLLRQES
jgi:energy-coupling factor transporter ATP-binding protein EcfA2